MQALHLAPWFQPSISIQSPEQGFSITDEPARTLILPGDLLHCDMGFHYLGLATDQQQHAYVLRPGESEAPAGLQAALPDGNALQDILMREMQVGRTGNEVLSATLAAAAAAGIQPIRLYPSLRIPWPRRRPHHRPLGSGRMVSRAMAIMSCLAETCYSIELNVSKPVPEWGDAEVKIALEEDAYLDQGTMRYLHARQTQFHLI